MPSPCSLPPLILHPFASAVGPSKLINASRASLELQGLLPSAEGPEELDRILLEGRYCELMMLFYLGKDLTRWTTQCVETVCEFGKKETNLRSQSFAALLVEDPPACVLNKLQTWGVHEHKSIFARAFGLHATFEQLPGREHLSPTFVRNYHPFVDQMFACYQRLFQFQRISSADFDFQLYASGEYTKMLEAEWGAI